MDPRPPGGIRPRPDAPRPAAARRGDPGARPRVAAAETRAQEAQARRNRVAREIGAAKKRGEAIEPLLRQIDERQGSRGASRRRSGAAARRRSTRSSPACRTCRPKRCRTGRTRPPIAMLRHHGEPPQFDFAPLSHEAIGERLGMMDFARAGEVVRRRALSCCGARSPGSSGRSANSCSTCIRREFGYTEVSPPLLVRDEAVFGTGQLPKFAEDLFRTTDGLLADPDRRGAADQSRRRRNPRRKRAAAALYRLDAVLPLGGGRGRARTPAA